MDNLLNKLIYEISLVDLTKEQANRINPIIEQLEKEDKIKDLQMREYERLMNFTKIDRFLVVSILLIYFIILIFIT